MSDTNTEQTEVTERPAGEAGTETTGVTTEATEQRAADDTGEKAVPYHRFREVNEVATQYKKLGKPAEVEARLAKLAEIEERDYRAAQQAEEAQRRQANPKLADAEDLVVDIVNRKFPGAMTAYDRQRELERMQVEAHVQRGFEAIPKLLTDHNLRADAESVESYETLVESQILKDDTLKRDFWSPAKQAGVIAEAFTRVKNKLVNPALQAAGARTLDEAKSRRARTIDRATPSGTTHAKPLEFKSQHKPGTTGYDKDRAAYRDAQMDAHLDAIGFDGEEAVSI